jgi:peptidoglycan/xylan/chitin deacetylase (PgdA/CDA1 family)
MSGPLTIVMYHYVRPIAGGRDPNLRGLEPAQFAGQLDYIEKHYRPVTLEQVLAAADGASLPERAALLQFDDGYTDHLDHVFPELQRRGIQGCFYPIACSAIDRSVIVAHKVQFVLARTVDPAPLVADLERAVTELGSGRDLPPLEDYRARHHVATRLDTAPVIYLKRMLQMALPRDLAGEIADLLFRKYVSADERAFADELYLSVDQLQTLLDAGHHIGCHTNRHPWLGSLTKAQQRAEIVSALRLHDRLALPRRGFTFCFPYGDYNTDTLDVLAELGCAAGFTAEVALADPLRGNRLALPRLDTIDLPMHGSAEANAWTRKAMTSDPAASLQ